MLVPLFLLMTAGVAVTSLYCHGKISEVGIVVKACCKDVNKGGCCNTESKIYKVKDTFVGATGSSGQPGKFTDLYVPGFSVNLLSGSFSVIYYKTYRAKAPPLIKAPLYLLYRSLII